MALNADATPRGAFPRRPATLAIAALLLMLGLYPGPLVLLQDPAWRTHPVVMQLAEARTFWTAGLLLIIGPPTVLVNLFPGRFDAAWYAVRDRLHAVRERRFMIAAAIVASVLAAAVAIYVFSRKPTTSDEVAQLWHARILLTGRLWLPADPNPEFFAIDNVIDQGRWYSQFPIGAPVALAIPMALRATWLLNPLLAGLVVINVYRFAARVYGTDEARLGALLCATCPFLLLMSGSYMNHTLVAFLTTLALAELPAWTSGTDRRRQRASVVIGLSLGAAIAVRPVDGAMAMLVFGGLLVQQAVQHRRVRALVLAVAAGSVPIAGLLVANWLTTGQPLLFGYEVLWGANHSLGFHNDPSGNAHTPRRALELVIAYLVQLNWALFGWPIAGLLVVAGALVAIGALGQWEFVLIAWIEAQLLVYAAYWHEGLFLGPRYLFTIVPAFLILAARGIVLAARRGSPAVRRSLVAAVAASLLGPWLIPSSPFGGALGAAKAARPLRSSLKLDLEPALESLEGRKALIFVGETASNRLVRRLWSLGIARPDATRLVAEKDNCALLDAAVGEAQRVRSPIERLAVLERTKRYSPPEGLRLVAPDPRFRVSDEQSVTPMCEAEAVMDGTSNGSIAYGQALLRNEIGRDGHIAGPIVFVADIAEHNEVLRARFGDRPWYRLHLPERSGDRVPRLVPYQ
jgi:hypothetical protein